MPLRVHCPSGCLIHMSTNRAGRIVRCPQCKTAIRIPIIPDSELAIGKPVPCYAREAIRRSDAEQDPGQEIPELPTEVLSSSPLAEENTTAGEPGNAQPVEREMAALQSVGPADSETIENQRQPRLEVPDLVKPLIKRRRPVLTTELEAELESEIQVNVHPVPEFENDDSRELTDQEIAAPVDPNIDEEVVRSQDLDDGNIVTQPQTTQEEIEPNVEPNVEQVVGRDEQPSPHVSFAQQVAEPEIIQSEIAHPVANASVADEALADGPTNQPVAIEPPMIEPDIEDPSGPISAPTPVKLEDVEPEGAEPATVVPESIESETAEPENVEPENVEPENVEPENVEPETTEPATVESENVESETGETEPTDGESGGVEQEIEEESPPLPELIESYSKPGFDLVSDQIDFLPRPARAKFPESVPIISLDEAPPSTFVAQEERNWEERLKRANADRRMLARFFAVCLCFVALINMVPALYHWYHWTQLAESMALPRWIYIQVFVGAIHLVYAVFLFQINDWSAMRAVSVAMLAVAFIFGFISTGLLVGGGQGDLTGFLGIPYTLNRQACIWCVAMLCLATLMSYWGGKESANWQRAESLLKDILSKSAI